MESPITLNKIDFKISEINRRLQSELKVQTGMENMLRESTGPNRDSLEAKLKDCLEKITLFQRCLAKYQNLRSHEEDVAVISGM
jgi:hypothetical protein